MLGLSPLAGAPLADDGALAPNYGALTAAFGAILLTADGDVPRTGTLNQAIPALAATIEGDVPRTGTLTYAFAAVAKTIAGTRTQFANPSSDVTTNDWTNELGGTTNLYQSIDEPEADDNDYISSPIIEVGGNSYYETQLGPLSDPLGNTGHVVRYRIGKASGGATLNATISLRQGATEVASWSHTVTSTVTYNQTLTSGQADSITDYGDLRLRFYLEAA